MSRQLGKSRVPFFGTPEDAAILGEAPAVPELHGEAFVVASIDEAVKPLELPADIPLGFHQHQGENRATRRKNSATWAPQKGVDTSRRELLEQRQKHQRGKLDPELRRLQKRKAESK